MRWCGFGGLRSRVAVLVFGSGWWGWGVRVKCGLFGFGCVGSCAGVLVP
mgnify:CR=1 FL=1